MPVRPSRIFIEQQSRRLTTEAARSSGETSRSCRLPNSASLSIACARTKLMTGQDRQAHWFMPRFVLMPSMSSTERWKATRRWASPICRISHRKRGGEMTNEKVDVIIVGAGASGSVYASVLGKGGRKDVSMDVGPQTHI